MTTAPAQPWLTGVFLCPCSRYHVNIIFEITLDMENVSWKLILILAAVGLFLVLAVPILRSTIETILGPAVKEFSRMVVFSLVWVVKTLWTSHWILLRALLTPKNLLFPSLSNQLKKEEDQKRER